MTVDKIDGGRSHEGPKSDPPEPLQEPGVDLERSYPICGDLRRVGFRALYAPAPQGLVICHGVCLQVELS